MDFVLDCSVTMSWCFESENDAYAEWLFGILDTVQTIVVPGIWPLEVANVLVVGERRRRLSQSDTAQFLSLLDRLPIELDSRSPYLAMRRNLPLATLDAGLLKASERLGIKVFAPKHSKV